MNPVSVMLKGSLMDVSVADRQLQIRGMCQAYGRLIRKTAEALPQKRGCRSCECGATDKLKLRASIPQESARVLCL